MVQAGSAPNVIPGPGQLAGTVRMLDAVAWADAEHLVREPWSARSSRRTASPRRSPTQRGVPPVVNDAAATAILAGAVERVLGVHGHVSTTQSLGGEDFGWYLEPVPGAMARLGTRTPGGPTFDLHQGDLRVDERATVHRRPGARRGRRGRAHRALSRWRGHSFW